MSTTSRRGCTTTRAARSRSSPSPARMPPTPSWPTTRPPCASSSASSPLDLPPASADFHRLLAHLSSTGLFERVSHTAMFLLVAMSVLFYVALYCVLSCSSTRAHKFAGGLIGFIWIQSGWIDHDSSHHQITRHPALNRLLQVVSRNCLTGLSIACWKFNHNTHHIAWWKFSHNTHHIAEYYFLGGINAENRLLHCFLYREF
ncbi:hypothetical protein ZWY2020_029432 [Hordeum vulgare]|nr:hypothetical protein ZWY2020_029432 [Hordeum vulgare]